MAAEKITLCPACGAAMKLRAGKFGKFYGCTKFPGCRGVVNYGGTPQNFDNEMQIIKTKWISSSKTMVFSLNNQDIAKWIYKEDGEVEKEGSVISGLVSSVYPNGALKAEITFENNEMNGPYEEFDINGNLKEKGTYIAGEKKAEFTAASEPYAVDDVSAKQSENDGIDAAPEESGADTAPQEEKKREEKEEGGVEEIYGEGPIKEENDEDLPF